LIQSSNSGLSKFSALLTLIAAGINSIMRKTVKTEAGSTATKLSNEMVYSIKDSGDNIDRAMQQCKFE